MNFSGMMRGLGAGIVNVGQMMKDQQKLDWETQQANLKYERDQHMAELNRKNQNAENQANRDLTVSEAQKGRDLTISEGTASRGLQQQQIDQTKAYQTESIEVQKEQIAATRAAQAQAFELNKQQGASQVAYQQKMLENNAKELDLKTKAYNDSTPEGQLKFRQKQADTLVLAGVPPKAVELYVATGDMPKLDKESIPVTAADIEARREAAGTTFDGMDRTEKKKFMADEGVESNSAAREKFQVMQVQNLMLETGHGSSAQGSSKSSVGGPSVTKEDKEFLKGQTPEARNAYIAKVEAKDPTLGSALRRSFEEAPTGAANTSMSGAPPKIAKEAPGIMSRVLSSPGYDRGQMVQKNPKGPNETDLSYKTRIDRLMNEQ